MKFTNALLAAAASALIASGGFAWAAYTGQLNIIQWAGTVLGAPSNFGTSPGAVMVPGVNASTTPRTGSFTFPGCTVGTSSAQCLAGATAVNHVQLQNESVGATIYCAWGATAVANSSGSFQLTAGQSVLWGPATSGVPSAALNCIATAASTPLYLEYN